MRPISDDPYSRKTVDEIVTAQRRLSPKFPTVDEARARYDQMEDRVGRVVVIAIVFVILAIVWGTS
jgi:hypothetical protein